MAKRGKGRPPTYKEAMDTVTVRLPEHQKRWLDAQPGLNISDKIRSILEEKIGGQKFV